MLFSVSALAGSCSAASGKGTRLVLEADGGFGPSRVAGGAGAAIPPLSPSLGLVPHQRAVEEIAHQVHLYLSFQLWLFVFACFT